MSRFFPTTFAIIACSIFVSTVLRSSDLRDSAGARFDQADEALDKIVKQKGAEHAAGEIAVAGKWIADGRALIESGDVKDAAKLAERLPFQIDLIRSLISAGIAASQAKEEERGVFELEMQLQILKARRDRLLLEIHGQKVSGAFPPKREAAP